MPGIAGGLRVAIVDDHPVMRESVGQLLEDEGAEIVVSCAQAERAWLGIQAVRPDVAIIDIAQPGMPGEDLIHWIIDAPLVNVNILVLSGDTRVEVATDVLHAGARGYILKQSASETILGATIAVGLGEPFIDPTLCTLIEEALESPRLSSQEVKVLSHIAHGNSAGETAKELSIAEATVRRYLKLVYKKLGVHNAPEAVTQGMRRGFLRGEGFD